jgi:hypothetical protein
MAALRKIPALASRPVLRDAMRLALLALLALLAVAGAPASARAATSAESALPRIEARSSDLLAVGVVRGDRMAIRLSRLVDNAPVGDAVVAVMLRGTTHPAVAESDGSYSFESSELALPGPASIEILVTAGNTREELKGTLDVARPSGQADNRGSSRQIGWWVLNFAVCIGFLWLWTRRKSADT